jgi:tetratricopeptide (TPR) repeat protein
MVASHPGFFGAQETRPLSSVNVPFGAVAFGGSAVTNNMMPEESEPLWVSYVTPELLEAYEATPEYNKKLNEHLQTHRTVLISGITGSGKSTFALAYLVDFFREIPEKRFVYVLNVQTDVLYQNSLHNLAGALIGHCKLSRLLNNKQNNERRTIISHLIQNALCNNGQAKKWMILLDNLDQDAIKIIEDYNKIIRGSRDGITLITTQRRSIMPILPSIDLSTGITSIQAKNLIKKLLSGLTPEMQDALGTEKDWDGLVEDVNRLPLALSLAGHYLCQSNLIVSNLGRLPSMTIADYRALLLEEAASIEAKQTELLQETIGAPREEGELKLLKTQHAAVKISISKAIQSETKDNRGLLQLMCFCGFLHSDFISQNLLINYVEKTHPHLSKKQCDDEFFKFYRRLSDYSLLQIVTPNPPKSERYLHMHRCVQEVLRDEYWKKLLPDPKQDLKGHQAVRREERNYQLKALESTWEQDSSKSWDTSDGLKLHIDTALDWLKRDGTLDVFNEPAAESLKIKLADYVSNKTWDPFQIFMYLINWLHEDYEPTVTIQEKIQAYILLSDTYIYLNPKKSEEVMKKAFFYLEQRLGDDMEKYTTDSQLVAARMTKGIFYNEQHQWKKAEPLFEIIISNKNIEEKDPILHLRACEYLGRLYYWQDRLKEAEDMFTKTQALKPKVLKLTDKNNRDSAHTLFELGVVFKLQGKYEEAQRNLQQAYDIMKELYKDNLDLGIVHISYELGQINSLLKKYEFAEKYYREALDILDKLEKEYIKKFRNIVMVERIGLEQFKAWNLHGLGEWSAAQSQGDAALEYFTDALKIQKQVYEIYKEGDAADLDIAVTLNSLGKLCLAKGAQFFEKSEHYLQQSFNMQIRLYGKEFCHTVLATTLYLLGQLALNKNEYAKATSKFSEAKQILQKIHGQSSEHPNLLLVEEASLEATNLSSQLSSRV